MDCRGRILGAAWGLALLAGCRGAPGWQQVTTVAGGEHGYAEGTGAAARFNWPMGIAYAKGMLYVTDVRNHRIRRIDPDGRVTTFAGGVKGFADGQGAQARFSYPRDVAADAAGNLYVADTTNRRIRKITPDGHVTTVAGTGKRGHTDGPGRMATFQSPWGLGAGPDGTIVVADTSGHSIRRVAPDGRVTTIAGAGVAGFANGKGTKARFYLPRDVAFTPGGSVLVADAGNHRVRRILQDGTVVTLAGSEAFGYADGRAEVAMFGYITGIAVEADGSALVTDETHHCIRRITPDGTVTTLAGRNQEGWIDGPGPLARFHWPTNVALGPGFCYVADPGNFRIRKIALP